MVAIDVNTAKDEEFLNSFTLTDLTTGTDLYSFAGGLIGTPLANNGNGYADGRCEASIWVGLR